MAELAAATRVQTRRISNRWWLSTLFFAIAAIAGLSGWATDSTFLLRVGAEALIFTFPALSVDILLGYTGLLSLGQAMFFGLGAYLSGLLLKDADFGFWSTLGATLIIITPTAFLAGIIAIRSRGVYFILLTFAMAEVVAKAIYNTRSLGGSDGIIGIPIIHAPLGIVNVNLGNPAGFFFLMLAAGAAMLAMLAYLMSTPFGHMLLAIRSNETRLSFLGFNPWRYKLGAYVVAANVAALGGALYPMLRGFISPDLLAFGVSANATIAVIIGGMGTLIGAFIGSFILTGLTTFISGYTQHHEIVIGIIFVVAVLFLPRGVIGLGDRLLGRRR